MRNLDRHTLIIGAGASVGVIQTVLFKQYIDPNYGKIPFLGDYIPAPWGYWSTGGNIIIGGILFAITSFTDLINNRSPNANDFLQMYGLTTLVGGVMNGVFYGATLGARARVSGGLRLAPRNNRMSMAPLTQTGIPAVQVLS